ncbi:hypothetical protein GTA26_29040 [Rhodococcus hoagii]|nr:hypothetical protein [Prescottella equi]
MIDKKADSGLRLRKGYRQLSLLLASAACPGKLAAPGVIPFQEQQGALACITPA